MGQGRTAQTMDRLLQELTAACRAWEGPLARVTAVHLDGPTSLRLDCADRSGERDEALVRFVRDLAAARGLLVDGLTVCVCNAREHARILRMIHGWLRRDDEQVAPAL